MHDPRARLRRLHEVIMMIRMLLVCVNSGYAVLGWQPG